MRKHPLTPMTDANLVRVLQAQTKQRVGLIDHRTVAAGEAAIRTRVAELQAEGVGIAIVDVVCSDDLLRLGPALRDLPPVTAGSGVALGLPANFGLAPSPRSATLPPAHGRQAIVSGSCSTATNAQVAAFIASGGAAPALEPLRMAAGEDVAGEALAWARPLLADGPVLLYSTAQPEAVQAIQARVGVEEVGAMVERTIARIACDLVEDGVRQLAVAGGETLGACVQALEISRLLIGPQIDPAVPWCLAASPLAPGGLHVALKSGNFGTPDFFARHCGCRHVTPRVNPPPF